MAAVIDVDQHLYEPRDLWLEHIDPGAREEALSIEDDELGYSWLSWRGRRLDVADVQFPGDTKAIGSHRECRREGEPSEYDYDETLPAHYWEPGARVAHLDRMRVDEAVLFPNFGLLWERRLSESLSALTANMAAWNRWCASVVADGRRRLHPVAHLTLRDPAWLEVQLRELSAAGVRLGMIAPAPVDGRPLSDPAHDRLWSAFVETGVTPVFHVADQPRVIDEAFFTDPDDSFVSVLESVFIWVPPAVAVTDLIVNGVLERHPDLRIGIVELSAIWVPQYLLMLDGGFDFTSRLNGRSLAELSLRPSEYFQRQVRVASFSYEEPGRLMRKSGDLFMFCSDFPHSEGTGTPVDDYARAGCSPDETSGLFAGNAQFLLGGRPSRA
jgi:predicted TIM-barrel fold metal-dependent hydrolase